MFTSFKSMAFLLGAALVVSVGASSASAVVFADVKNDFGNGSVSGDTSATVNPTDTLGTGRWDYFQTDTFGLGGNESLLGWDPGQNPGSGPNGRYERTGVNHAGGGQFDFVQIADQGGYGHTANANEVFIHPSDTGNFANPANQTNGLIRWSAGAGAAGDRIIQGSFRRPDTFDAGAALKIFVDGVERFDSGAVDGSQVNYSIDATLTNTSVVDFVIDSVGNQHNADSTYLAATIRDAGATALWKASEYQGGDWIDSIQGIAAAPRDNPTANVIDGVEFDGNDAFTVSAANNPLAGLNDFTVTAVFEADGTQGEGGATRSAGDTNQFWQVAHLAGIEQPGAGAGDWGIGINGDQEIRGGAGLQGDITASDVAGPFNDGQDHIVTMVMDAQNQILKIFVDGSLESFVAITPNTTVDEGFVIGSNGANNFSALGDLAFYTGHIIEVALHDFSLTDEQVQSIHRAGTAMQMDNIVPEPTTAVLGLLGLAGLASRRRRMA